MSTRVLVVDDELAIVQALKMLLTKQGYDVTVAADSENALRLLQAQPCDVMISDIRMQPMDGLELLRRARALYPQLAVIMMTGYGSTENAVQALKSGAFDFVTKPFRIDEMVLTVERAITFKALQAENAAMKAAMQVRYHCGVLAGDSPRMLALYERLTRAAAGTATVLILGAAGTGKTLAAQAVHALAGGDQRPLVRVPCRELKEDATEARLGGDPRAAGNAFADARGGSLVLDDVAALGKGGQLRLLHWLRDRAKAAPRPGAPAVRLVLCSDRPLAELAADGHWLAELQQELSPVVLALPLLIERVGDLPILVRHFLNQYTATQGTVLTLEPAAMAVLERHDWPENVRELQATLQAAAAAAKEGVIRAEHLPEAWRAQVADSASLPRDGDLRWRSLKSFLHVKEQEYVAELLRRCQGDAAAAAQKLGISLDEFNRRYPQSPS